MAPSTLLRSRIIQKPYQLFHYYFLLEKQPGSTLSDLSFETDIKLSINKFKNHHWTIWEIVHYSFLTSIILFVFLIFPASFFIKLPILLIFSLCFLLPFTSQFFVHALPIFTWLALFFSAGKIPDSWKPAISVKLLPAMETILYGDNLSNVLAEINNSFFDVLAWLPYGIIHFSSPFVVAAFIFIFGPPTGLRSFGFAFGYMNLIGLLTQILFPAAPPWYKNLHGLEPADYSMSGSPGGLGRIDSLLGVDLYTTTFSNSPVVFGAFPSLHSGCAVMDVLFLSWLFPKLKFVWWGYATWLWWSTMYLTHHYFIDLIGGAVLSYVVFSYTKYNHLPIMEPTKFCRWSYTTIEKIDVAKSDPLNAGFMSSLNQSIDVENRYYQFSDFPTSLPYINTNSVSTENFEMTGVSRSRQSSRTNLPTTSSSNNEGPVDASAYRASGKSTSALSLVLPNELHEEEEEGNQSLTETDNSTTNSMFENDAHEDDERHQISSTTSSTSLDELESQHQSGKSKKGYYKSR